MALARLRLGTLVFLVGENAEAARIMEATYFEAAQAEELEVAFMAAAQLVGVLGYQLARHDEALRWARHAELVLARMPGANDVMRAPLLVDLSTVYFAMGDYPQAQATAQRVLEVYEESLGPVHPLVADALTNLGLFHLVRGDYAEAKALLERALVIREQTQGTLHSQMADLLSNIGSVELRLGDSARAVELFERALSIREASLEPDHPALCAALGNLAAAHHERGEDELATSLFERAVESCERGLGPDDFHTASTRSNYADTLRARGKLDDAREQFERALRGMEAALGPEHPDLSYPLQGLANVAEAQGRFDDAVVQAERAVRVRHAAGSASDLVGEARFVLARAKWQQGLAREDALAQARKALEEYREQGSASAEAIAEIEQWLAAHAPQRGNEHFFWRVYAGEDGVTINTAPAQPGFPVMLNKGQFYQFQANAAPNNSFVFTGDGPFMPVQYLEGQTGGGGTGDPSMIQSVPTEQYLDAYAFVTGTGYDVHYVQIIRPLGGAEVFIDGNMVGGYYAVGNYQVADVQVSEGAHFATSDQPFGIVQVGYTPVTSYAYPGGLKLTVINPQ